MINTTFPLSLHRRIPGMGREASLFPEGPGSEGGKSGMGRDGSARRILPDQRSRERAKGKRQSESPLLTDIND